MHSTVKRPSLVLPTPPTASRLSVDGTASSDSANAAPYSQSWPAGKLSSGSGVRYGAWMGEPGFIKVDSYPHDEFFIMRTGVVKLLGTEGDELEVRAGDTCLIHRGWAGTWQTVETTHKVYIIIDPKDASGIDTTSDVVS